MGACIRTANICKTQKTLRSNWIWLPDCKQWTQTLFCAAHPQQDESRGQDLQWSHQHMWLDLYHTHVLFRAQKKDCPCSAVFFSMCVFPPERKKRNAKHLFSVIYMKVKEASPSSPKQCLLAHTLQLCHLEEAVFSSHFTQVFLFTPQLQKLLCFNASYPKQTGTIIQLKFLVACYHPKTEDLNNLFEAMWSAVKIQRDFIRAEMHLLLCIPIYPLECSQMQTMTDEKTNSTFLCKPT